MKFGMTVLVAGFAAGLPLAAAAAPASQAYVESSGYLTGGAPGAIDLGEVPNTGGPVVGPDGVGSGFDAVGERVNIRGALNVAKDRFSVAFDTPGLRFDINELTFYETGDKPSTNTVTTDPNVGGTLELSFDNGTSATFDADDMPQSFAFSSMDSALGFEFDNVAGGELIEYDVDLVATPLPGTAALFGAALAGLGVYRRRAAARA
jgi:hypothetical protein